jgi:hypothetical protein
VIRLLLTACVVLAAPHVPAFVSGVCCLAASKDDGQPRQTPDLWPHHGVLRRGQGHHRVRGQAVAFGPPGSVAFVCDVAFVLDGVRAQW